MKKTLITLILVAVAAILTLLIFHPELLNTLGITSPAEETPAPAAPVAAAPPNPEPAPPARKRAKAAPAPPDTGQLDLNHLAGRRVHVNGTERTGESQIEVEPGPVLVTSWSGDGRHSHEWITVEAGATVSPEGRQEQSDPPMAWSGFQGGPTRSGQATSRDRDGFTLRWQSRAEDPVRGSAVISGGMAFFASDSCFVNGLDLGTGELRWSHGIVGSKVTPVAVGDFVFAGNDVGRFEGFRAAKGKLKGTASLGSGLSSLAALSDDLLLTVTRGGSLQAIATRKNMVGRVPLKVRWETTATELGDTTATPLVLGDRVVIQAADGTLHAFSAADGRRIWPATEESTDTVNPAAEPNETMTFRFASGRGFLTPTPAAQDGVIYAVHGGRLSATASDDGKRLWSRTFDGAAASSVSLAWGMIYLGCTDGSVRAFSSHGGEPVFHSKISDMPVNASPVLFDGQLLAATGEGNLVLLDAWGGTELAVDRTLSGSPIDATPAVWGDGILAVNRDGLMACFE